MTDAPDRVGMSCTNCGEYVGTPIADAYTALLAERDTLRSALENLIYLQSGGPCAGIQSEQWLSEARAALSEGEKP